MRIHSIFQLLKSIVNRIFPVGCLLSQSAKKEVVQRNVMCFLQICIVFIKCGPLSMGIL
jgi:hypothetical protein